MKYIRIQKVVQKFYDDDIDDIETIKAILNSIMDRKLYCSVTVQESYHINYLSKVRILKVCDASFDFRVFQEWVTLKDSARYEDLKELKVETEIDKVMDTDDKDNRWLLLDLEEEK